MKATICSIQSVHAGSNAYLYSIGSKAVMIDCGLGAEALVANARNNGIEIEAILLTHCHFDHISGLDTVLSAIDVPVYIHFCEKEYTKNSYLCLANLFAKKYSFAPDYLTYSGEDILRFGGGIEFSVIHTPGHSLGSSCFYDGEVVFSGDTLFRGTIGRADHLFGDTAQEIRSIRTELLKLPGETTVLPGHSHVTTIEDEINYNQFIRKDITV